MTDRERIAERMNATIGQGEIGAVAFRSVCAEVERLILDAASRAYRSGWYDGNGEDENEPLWEDQAPTLEAEHPDFHLVAEPKGVDK